MDYIKIYTDMEEFFVGEDIPDEMTGKLLKACFAYVKTGDAHIEDLFEPGSAGRMAWKAIRRHLDACSQKAETNAQNRTGKAARKTAPTQSSADDNPETALQAAATASSREETETDRNESERIGTNNNEQERPGTTPFIQEQKQIHTHTQSHTQPQRIKKYIQEQQHNAREDGAAPAAGWMDAAQKAQDLGVIGARETGTDFRAACLRVSEECTPEWAEAALEQCARNHSCSWAYFAAVLRGYQRSGHIDTRSGRPAQKVTYTDYAQRPNDLPDGDAIPMWLQDRMAASA